MIYKNKVRLSITYAILIVSGFASANEEQSLSESYCYMQLNGGVTYNSTGSSFSDNKNANHTGIYGIEVGYKFDDYTRASLSLDYMPNYSFTTSANENTSGIIDGTPYVITSNNNFKVNSWVMMFNAYYDIKNTSNFTPYVTLGAGVARNEAKSTYNSLFGASGNLENNPVNLAKYTKDNFAYKIGVGAKYAINKSFDFDLRYQFVDMGKFTTASGSYTLDGATYTLSEQTVKLKAQEILIGIAYKF